MKILINTSSTFKGGSVQVAKSFIEECKKIEGNYYHVVLGVNIAKQINVKDFPKNFTFFKMKYRPATKVLTPFYNDKELKKQEFIFQPDVVFSTTGPSYAKFKCPHLVGYNLPHYIYQESPYFKLINPYLKMKWYLKSYIIKHFFKRDSDAIVCQTNDVSARAKKFLKIKKSFTVFNTANQYFIKKSLSSYRAKRDSKDKFEFLCMSSYHSHKNLEILNSICEKLYAKKIRKIHFILTLDNEKFDHIFSDVAKSMIKNIGPVEVSEAPNIYEKCDAVFLPSLLECFSANYPEAMIMEKPIITTNLSFALDVCGSAAVYYKANDACDATKKIIDLVNSNKQRVKLVELGKEQLKKFNGPFDRAKLYLNACKVLIKYNE